jgi:two-component system chemotaxis sensor kinase CheA
MSSMSNDFDVRAQIREQIEKLNTWVLIQDTEAICGKTLREQDVAPDFGKCACSDERLSGTVAELKSMLEMADREGGIPASLLRDKLSELQQKFEMSEVTTEGAAAAPEASSVAEDPALVADFVLEAREHLSAVEAQLLILENDPGNFECLNAIFRSFHSIKGLAAFLEFPRIQHFAHEVETLLDAARNKAVVIDATGIDLILACTDFLNRCIAAVESRTLMQVPRREDELIPRLQGFRNAGSPAAEQPPSTASESPAVSSISPEVLSALELDGLIPIAAAQAQPLPEAPAPSPKPPEKAERLSTEKPDGDARSPGGSVTTAERYSVRVDTSKLDYLMDMVGELVITESLIKTALHAEYNLSTTLNRNLVQLARLTGDVQRATLTMRMIPIGQLFRRLARMVRDLARKFSKQVELRMEGEETELDKTIAEELADPLMHMVRNSLDHGVEDRAGRLAAGKSANAVVTLRAYHEGGQVVIEVEDDGHGINREKVLKKARQQGMEVSDSMSDSEVLGLIFQPGFSTAEQVTDISGRGVGMDVVRRQVDKLRGKVDVESTLGKGTKFIIQLPLTRAIIEGLIVSVGKLRCIVPLSSVKEVLRPKKEALSTLLDKEEMVMVHNRLLPIVRLHRRFSIEPTYQNPEEAVLIVCEASGRTFCLMVDSLDGKQEVVIKNLGAVLKKTGDVSGGAILGDGRVGLILDVSALEGAVVNG